jgi:hypothetical protein
VRSPSLRRRRARARRVRPADLIGARRPIPCTGRTRARRPWSFTFAHPSSLRLGAEAHERISGQQRDTIGRSHAPRSHGCARPPGPVHTYLVRRARTIEISTRRATTALRRGPWLRHAV